MGMTFETWPCFLPSGPRLDVLLPSTAASRLEFSCCVGTIKALRFLRLTVPRLHLLLRSQGPKTQSPGPGVCRFANPFGRSAVETTGPLRFLRNPHCPFAMFLDSRRTDVPRTLREVSAVPAISKTRTPALAISNLNSTAFQLAVCASPGRSLYHSARLASRCWLDFPGQGWLPAGFH